MAFQVSPGVEVKEIDATSVIPAVSTSIGGFAGSFNWGPVGEIKTVGSESELAEHFGTPDDSTAKYFLTAAAFLEYGNALKVVRVLSGHDNATGDGSGQLIKNKEEKKQKNMTYNSHCQEKKIVKIKQIIRSSAGLVDKLSAQTARRQRVLSSHAALQRPA